MQKLQKKESEEWTSFWCYGAAEEQRRK